MWCKSATQLLYYKMTDKPWRAEYIVIEAKLKDVMVVLCHYNKHQLLLLLLLFKLIFYVKNGSFLVYILVILTQLLLNQTLRTMFNNLQILGAVLEIFIFL